MTVTSGSRFERIKGCDWCGLPLPRSLRPEARYCSGKCRAESWREKAFGGRVSSVRRLKDGRMSVVVHMVGDVGLRPGDQVGVGALPKDSDIQFNADGTIRARE